MRHILPLLIVATILPAADLSGGPSGETPWQRADRIDALERSLDKGSKQQRLAVLNQLARNPERGLDRALDSALRDSDPVILAAAINVVARSWPTSDHHLARIRQEAASEDPGVALAAIGALGAIGDDDRMELLASRLRTHGDPSIAASAHAALVRLMGVDAGGDEEAWRNALAIQRKAVGPQLDQVREAMSGDDSGRIRQAMHQMLMLRGARSERAQLLAELSDHRDPAIRKLAAEGLANIGGGVAALALASGLQGVSAPSVTAIAKPAAATARTTSSVPAGGTPWAVIASVVGSGIAVVGWMLFRSPVKKIDDLQKATRSFRRVMVKNGDLRRLAQTRTKLEETGLFRRSTGASGVRTAGGLGSAR